jgi:hypothetical protein
MKKKKKERKKMMQSKLLPDVCPCMQALYFLDNSNNKFKTTTRTSAYYFNLVCTSCKLLQAGKGCPIVILLDHWWIHFTDAYPHRFYFC